MASETASKLQAAETQLKEAQQHGAGRASGGDVPSQGGSRPGLGERRGQRPPRLDGHLRARAGAGDSGIGV